MNKTGLRNSVLENFACLAATSNGDHPNRRVWRDLAALNMFICERCMTLFCSRLHDFA